MFFVYIIQSVKSGRFYIGHSENPLYRVEEHNSGKVVSTKNKGPWVLVRTESFSTRAEAYRREHEVKGWKSAQRIRELVGLDLPEDREGR